MAVLAPSFVLFGKECLLKKQDVAPLQCKEKPRAEARGRYLNKEQ
jgi:hypothetical protein